MRHSLMMAFLVLFPVAASGQSVELRPIDPVSMPVIVDSNTPSFWSAGGFHAFSSSGEPLLSQAASPFSPWTTTASRLVGLPQPAWVESVHQEDDGTLLVWYHHEVLNVCPGSLLTTPKIGAAISYDGGHTLINLGFVLDSREPPDCSSPNGYFAGGHGDFSVIYNPRDQHFYFFFSTYSRDLDSQGIAVARLAWEDRFTPVGSVFKYHDGGWWEAGLGGRVTPVFPASTSWHETGTDAFWGPSVHWNTHLGKFVMLLNRSCCEPGWPQEGVYLSMSSSPTDPTTWSAPVRIVEGGEWYPHVLGLGPYETSSIAGETALLFLGNTAQYEIVFTPAPPVE
ncbi:MAG: hypothetical protein JNL98_22675 [Bryobacterales bacterium]|nr:hypothetical protein [Bryobacterales bacterium]